MPFIAATAYLAMTFGTLNYLKTVMPIFVAAVLLAGLLAGLLLQFDPSGVRS
ncbi:hypothetical protein [Sphingomonas sp. S-NIH.Pt15_0812]|uniref:hypothetical protein n=1 Tax=Sphingomonas sp. S-NIH.Pt15_0812 TaxID=1920129 RepID=UPI0019D0DBB2|nr:hypothetical protein [Sphingomonas sp. S-NIH.Pt15_0812]